MFARIITTLFIAFLLAQSATAQAAPRPNILFAIADDASYPHMGAYGCDWIDTPGFDRVARDGILFTNAYTPNAKCAPSRASILTGRPSWQLEAAANHWCEFPAKFKVYPEALAEAGYHVGSTGKGWAPGVAVDDAGQPRHLAGTPYDQHKTTPPTDAISAIDYAANFADFLDDQPGDAPFCFWYGGYEPHRAYEYGSGIRLGGKDPGEIDDVPDFWPDNETVRTDMLDYAYEIEYFDQHLVRMLDLLEARGMLDNTLVIVTADNGMPFPRAKGQAYMLSNHVPLAIMWPAGIDKPGRTLDTFVSFTDFAPTFLELAGITRDSSGMAAMEGKSFAHLLTNPQSTNHRDHVLIGKERHDIGRPNDVGYPIRGIVTAEWLYLKNYERDRWPAGNPETGYLNCDGSPTKTVILDLNRSGDNSHYREQSFGKRPAEELYDLQNDPDCVNNLAASETHETRKQNLNDKMTEALTAQQDPRVLGNGHVFDDYPYASERHRNFYEKFFSSDNPPRVGWVNETDFEPMDSVPHQR